MQQAYENINNNKLNHKIHREYINYGTKLIFDELALTNAKDPNTGEPDKAIYKRNITFMESFLFGRVYNILYLHTPPYHPYRPLKPDNEEYQLHMNREQLPYFHTIVEIFNERFDSLSHDTTYKNTITYDDKYLYLHDLKFKLDSRIRYMITYAQKKCEEYNHMSPEQALMTAHKLTIRTLLRYSSLGITGNHCSLSIDVYNYLYNNLNVRGEGFSSPLNSKLLEKDDTIICTIFGDTDKYFKSIGAFTKKTMIRYSSINWILNPPFLTSTVKLSIKSINLTLSTNRAKKLPPMTIIFVLPLTKLQHKGEIIDNEYLFGYINKTHVHIVREGVTIKKTERKDQAQYFICNDVFSSNFDDIYMLFYTDDVDIDYPAYEKHLLAISDLWTVGMTKDLQQSLFRNPRKI